MIKLTNHNVVKIYQSGVVVTADEGGSFVIIIKNNVLPNLTREYVSSMSPSYLHSSVKYTHHISDSRYCIIGNIMTNVIKIVPLQLNFKIY